jgi:hypothetical protein
MPSAPPTSGSTSIFGNVAPPAGVQAYDAAAGGNIGLLLFVSNMIKLVTVGAGLFVVFNVVYAGIMYVSSMGDSSVHAKVRDQLTYSVIGLVLIAASYAIAILIGFIFFGDPSFIINPQVCGPGGC